MIIKILPEAEAWNKISVDVKLELIIRLYFPKDIFKDISLGKSKDGTSVSNKFISTGGILFHNLLQLLVIPFTVFNRVPQTYLRL